jgi:hypothetical protein
MLTSIFAAGKRERYAQRKSPTGGAAYGMPLNTRTPPAATPRTSPLSVITTIVFTAALTARSGTADAETVTTHTQDAITKKLTSLGHVIDHT